jgi:hypothetical protein
VTLVSGRATRRAIDTLREQLAPNASNDELQWLAAVGQRLGLDPIAGHIVLIPRWDSRSKRQVHRPQITADGRLVLAERTGELAGFDGPEWCGERQFDSKGNKIPLDWLEVWDEDGPPYAARVAVYRRGRDRATNGTVRWREFAQTDSKGELLATWAKMPSHMLGKVALSLGLRRAFGDVIPAELELEDDFAPYERVDADTGEIDPGADAQTLEEEREELAKTMSVTVDTSTNDVLELERQLTEAERKTYDEWAKKANMVGVNSRPANRQKIKKITEIRAGRAEQASNPQHPADPGSDYDRYVERGGGLGT